MLGSRSAIRYSLFAIRASSSSVVRSRRRLRRRCKRRRAGDPPARPANDASARAGNAALHLPIAGGGSLAGDRRRARRAALRVPRHDPDLAMGAGRGMDLRRGRCRAAARRARRRRCWVPRTISPPKAGSSKPCTCCCCKAWRTSGPGLDEQFADSLTSREILRSTRLSDAGRASLRDIVNRVEWTYFGEHPAALAGLRGLPRELQRAGASAARADARRTEARPHERRTGLLPPAAHRMDRRRGRGLRRIALSSWGAAR